MDNKFIYDVGIIGIGRVGLPLALSLSMEGLNVLGIDRDENVIEKVNNKKMPFKEEGYDVVIKEVNLKATLDISEIKNAKNIIITVGTPLHAHIETDLSQIKSVITSIVDYIVPEHNIILRSTIAPNTTLFVKKLLEQKTKMKVGDKIFLSFCPERIAEGKALKELKELPQIIGSQDEMSGKRAEEVFSVLCKDILHTDYVSAELVKLFNNISRYILFSISNQFAMIADDYNANVYEILEMANYKYPRAVVSKPGFTAGTCLRKDFGMINEGNPYTDLMLSAWKINEYMPKFLVENLKRRIDIYDKNIAILGYTFKSNTDDIRDSLVPKLVRYIEREVPSIIKIHEPFLGNNIESDYCNTDLDDCLIDADIVFIATNHTSFSTERDVILNLIKPDAWIVDIWNVWSSKKIYYQAKSEENENE